MRSMALPLAGLSLTTAVARGGEGNPPAVGEQARDFTLPSLQGEKVSLSQSRMKGPVVVLVLRGYPGYQCPLCTMQVGDYIGKAKKFAEKNANVLLIYPGPAENLSSQAKEFLRGKKLPDNFHLLVDPGYTMVNSYGLRWDAPSETAYPSTFVVDEDGKVLLSRVSKAHGGRTKASETLAALPTKK
ncbi:peroxiredoxin family protein [bacterium]|nr:peroxiredoxin family protein [bacterium]